MGVFSGVQGAYAGGVRFQVGVYTVKVLSVKHSSASGESVLVIEAEILKSDALGLRSGTRCEQVINLSRQIFAPDYIRSFMSAAYNLAPEDITEREIEQAISTANPLKGTVLELFCTSTKTRSGADFMIHQ